MVVRQVARDISLSDMLRNAAEGIFVLDHNRQCVIFSSACERITGYHGDEVIPGASRGQSSRPPRAQALELINRLWPHPGILKGDIPHVRQRVSLRHRKGHTIWVESTCSPMRRADGSITHVLGFLRDLSEPALAGSAGARPVRVAQRSPDAVRRWSAQSPVFAGVTSSPDGQPLDDMLLAIERRKIVDALRRAEGKRTQAAESLGISRSRLYRRMEVLGINPDDHVGR